MYLSQERINLCAKKRSEMRSTLLLGISRTLTLLISNLRIIARQTTGRVAVFYCDTVTETDYVIKISFNLTNSNRKLFLNHVFK